MSTDLRPLSTGELLDKLFNLYRSNFAVFAGIAAVAYVISLILQLFLAFLGETGDPAIFGPGSALAVLIGAIGTLIGTTIAQGGTVYAVSTIYLGGTTSIGGALGRVSGKGWRIFGINFAVGLLTAIGFILLIFPGFYWLTCYSLAIPAAVLENLPMSDALARSKGLSEGSRLRILLIYVLVYVLRFAVVAGFGFFTAQIFSLSKIAGFTLALAFQAVLQFIVNTLVFPLLTIALVLVYYDQRVRKEAFDLQRLMEALNESPAQTAIGARGSVG